MQTNVGEYMRTLFRQAYVCLGHAALGAVAGSVVPAMTEAVSVSVYRVGHVDGPQSRLVVVQSQSDTVERTSRQVDRDHRLRRAAVVVARRRTGDERHILTVALDDAVTKVKVDVLAVAR